MLVEGRKATGAETAFDGKTRVYGAALQGAIELAV